ncbi:MAG: 30S ribosomal protein S17e, partial [Microcella sp.]|uniref:30S ribosomal protein S17e n=1 Tax=Microcella sp. TaxID=1913979 RepID=UPI002715AC04
MGNIRPTYIKRVAIELVERFPEKFTEDFDHNKKAVSELADFQGKSLRNRVAGYVTTYRRQQEIV